MPNELQQSEDAPKRAVDAADASMEERESSKRLKQTSKPSDVRRKSYEYANDFWKLLVRNVGESEAKSIMHRLMGDKKPGPRKTDQDVALTCFVYAYIIHCGLGQTDAKIAIRVFESSARYLEYASGAVAVANNEFTEAHMSLADDPIVKRRPIGMSLAAIKKRVERMRRLAIGDNLLPKEYAPRAYNRDS